MATLSTHRNALSINPLKLSQPLGASLAFLGIQGSIPLFHGSQGCTAFAKVILVRHFREAIPMSTTAMSEVNTILGGDDNIETAILTLVEKAKPEIIGLLTTGLTETRGDDMIGILQRIRSRHPQLDELPIVLVSAPDFSGSLQDGFAAAVESLVQTIPHEISTQSTSSSTRPDQITILASAAFTPGDLQEIKDIVSAFGLIPIVVPDLSRSLDGHLAETRMATSAGGTTIQELRSLSQSSFTLALGQSMQTAAQILEAQFGTPYEVFGRLTGLGVVDDLLMKLAQLSGSPVPDRYRHQRRQLQDAMLDTHFYLGGKRVALALEPDLLSALAWWLDSMGAQIHAAVTTTRSPLLEQLPVESVTIGDLGDFEALAAGADLLIGNSHVAPIARRLGIPLYRQGMPIVDRLGNGFFTKVGYRGTMQLLFDIGNLLLEQEEAHVHHADPGLVHAASP